MNLKSTENERQILPEVYTIVSFDEIGGDRDLINVMLLCKILDHQSKEKFVLVHNMHTYRFHINKIVV